RRTLRRRRARADRARRARAAPHATDGPPGVRSVADAGGCPPSGHGALELLLEGTHVELVRPRAPVLVGDEPERVRDGGGSEQVLVAEMWQELAYDRHVDRAVDVDVGDVHALRLEVARQHLREPADGELRGSERRG